MTLHAGILNWDLAFGRSSYQPLSFRQCNEDDMKEFNQPIERGIVDFNSWFTDMNCLNDLKSQTLQGHAG